MQTAHPESDQGTLVKIALESIASLQEDAAGIYLVEAKLAKAKLNSINLEKANLSKAGEEQPIQMELFNPSVGPGNLFSQLYPHQYQWMYPDSLE